MGHWGSRLLYIFSDGAEAQREKGCCGSCHVASCFFETVIDSSHKYAVFRFVKHNYDTARSARAAARPQGEVEWWGHRRRCLARHRLCTDHQVNSVLFLQFWPPTADNIFACVSIARCLGARYTFP